MRLAWIKELLNSNGCAVELPPKSHREAFLVDLFGYSEVVGGDFADAWYSWQPG